MDTQSHISFAQSTTGNVLLSSAKFYETTTQDAWGYLHDMARLAGGAPPDFGPPGGYGIPPDLASTLHANAVACSMAQMLAMDSEGLHTYFGSMLDFAGRHESLDGLESVFLSAGLTVLHELDSSLIGAGTFLEGVSDHMRVAGDLLERAGTVWDTVSGLQNVLTHSTDLIPVVDGLTGQFGFPALDTIDRFVHDPWGTIEGFAEKAAGSFLSPGHRIFDRVQHAVGVIDSDAGQDFASFRESDVGQFVETVASVAIGIGLLVEAPVVRAVKVGVAVADAAVTFIGGIFEAVFGASEDRQAGRGHEADHHDEIRRGDQAVVGCWVEDPEVVPDGPVRLPKREGTCPDPDLLQSIPASVPMPGVQGSWPTAPAPWLGGDGLGALVYLDDSQVTLQVAFDDSGLLDINGSAPSLGWDDAAFEAMTAEFDFLARLVSPELNRILSTRLDNAVVIDAFLAGPDRGAVWLRARQAGHHAAKTDGDRLLVIPGRNGAQVFGDAELAAAREVALARWSQAEQYGHEIKPIGAVVDLIPHIRDELALLRHSGRI